MTLNQQEAIVILNEIGEKTTVRLLCEIHRLRKENEELRNKLRLNGGEHR